MSMTTSTILLAEEHDVTREFLADNLGADGYEVLLADDRAKALALMSAIPDLILVDVNGQTLALIDAIRSGDGLAGRVDPDTPLIVLSHDADRLQRIRMLERGGDDVVVSRSPTRSCAPGSPPCYGARRSRRAARVLRVGPIVIDVRSREVRVFDRPVELSAKEYDLLVTLAGEPTRVFTREELLRDVWGFQTFGRTRTVDSHASRLRRKLCGDGARQLVVNVWGVGYRLVDAPGCGPMSDQDATPLSVVGLYQQLAAERAGAARAALARERTVEGLFAQAPPRSRTPPARCCTPPPRSSRSTGRCPACSPSRPARCSPSRRGSRRPPTSPAPANPTEQRREQP